jgi:hypothetical protein
MRKTCMIGLAMSLTGCALDDTDADLETTSQALVSGWAVGAWGTTTDLVGFDTGWSTSNSTCVLTRVTGNLTEGGYWQTSTDVLSTADVGYKLNSNGNYWIIGHGGAYTNQVNQRVWENNPVMAGAVCVPYTGPAEVTWKSQDPQYGVAAPKKVAGLLSTRRCFLTSIRSGMGAFGKSTDFARVVKVTSIDSKHPTTGWYIESNLESNSVNGQPAFVSAACIDFPSIWAEWGAWFGGATNTITPNGDSLPKMCGLTGLHGAWNVNSWTNGATINAPSTQGGLWSMTVSAGKSAEAICIE